MAKPFPDNSRIRPYRPADFDRLHRIDRICFPAGIAYSRDELLFYLRHPDSITRVAERADEIVGFAVGRIENEFSAHILTLDVIPEARRRKVGTALMAALHEEFEKRNIPMAFLEVDTDNEGALSFYERLDYEWVETVRGYYGGVADAHRMVRFARGVRS